MVVVLWDQQLRLCLRHLYQHLHLLVLLEREPLCRPELEHQGHHGLEVLEHLVRLDQEKAVALGVSAQSVGASDGTMTNLEMPSATCAA